MLKAPFPYFGAKSRAAHLMWERFGDTPNYVEPFAGSLAVLLARPHEPKTETVNDLDGLLSNAWRAIRLCPDEVAQYADQPVVEVDLHARHITLVNARSELTARLEADPDYCDPKLAGWWVWGACNWMRGPWGSANGPWVVEEGLLVRRPGVAGVKRQLPYLRRASGGGICSIENCRNYPDPEDAVRQWMRDLSARLKRVRITCGSWDRVVGDTVTVRHGLTAVLLDPPYDAEGAVNDVYGSEYSRSVAAEALAWAVENGDNPRLRIAYCGYDLTPPPGWAAVPWKARKGYQGVKSDGSHNGHREVILFSPHCLKPVAHSPLFAEATP